MHVYIYSAASRHNLNWLRAAGSSSSVVRTLLVVSVRNMPIRSLSRKPVPLCHHAAPIRSVADCCPMTGINSMALKRYHHQRQETTAPLKKREGLSAGPLPMRRSMQVHGCQLIMPDDAAATHQHQLGSHSRPCLTMPPIGKHRKTGVGRHYPRCSEWPQGHSIPLSTSRAHPA